MTKLPTTKLQRTFRRPASERGFTLIELLVVIIILGILAAVVVFAVSGVGDKGKSSAVAIDERTLQTAEEAYCAKNGRYADGSTLVAEGFLSDKPQYHNVGAQKTGGTCNGWTFSILPTKAAGANPGSWVATTDSPGGDPLAVVRLPDGKVLKFYFTSEPDSVTAASWDPATGQWTVLDPLPGMHFGLSQNHPLALADNPATPANECGTNCGKVLIHTDVCGSPAAGCIAWRLFNPQAPGGLGLQWEEVPAPDDTAYYSQFASNIKPLVQLRDDPSTPVNECGQNCGKVLITSNDANPFPSSPELFDPKVSGPAAFTSFGYTDPDTANLGNNTLLPDGRVLLVGRGFGGDIKAQLFNPLTLAFDSAAPPAFAHTSLPSGGGLPVLPGGTIFVPARNNPEIYTPERAGPGSWRSIVAGRGCPNAGASPNCHVFGSLPDGRVLGFSSTSSRTFPGSHTGKGWIFDPTLGVDRWVATTDLLNRSSMEGVSLDPRTGPCGVHCNKFLVVGSGPGATALYTP